MFGDLAHVLGVDDLALRIHHEERPRVETQGIARQAGVEHDGAPRGKRRLRTAQQLAVERERQESQLGQELSLRCLQWTDLNDSHGKPTGRKWPANLTNVDLSHANLEGALLEGANLRDARLNHTKLAKADLTGATLDGTVFSGADMKLAKIPG